MNYTAGERKKITSDDVDMRSSVDERDASLHDCFSSACLHFSLCRFDTNIYGRFFFNNHHLGKRSPRALFSVLLRFVLI